MLVKEGDDIAPEQLQIARDGGPYTKRGSTAHFNVYYENALGANGQTLADEVLATCEAEYFRLQGYFGGITPPGLPFNVYIVTGVGGAYHANCAATEMHCGADASTGASTIRMLVVAEEEEVFEAAYTGWGCGQSHGEALSRVFAEIMYPDALDGFATAASWLDGGRPDWIANTENTDRNYVSIGAGTLFLFYLRYQLGLTWAKIVKAGKNQATLSQTYSHLTGRPANTAYTDFKAFCDRHWIPGHPSGIVGTDNPFPLADGFELWHTWASLGGILESAPVTVSWGPNRFDTFAIGTNSALYHRWWDGAHWGGWESLGGICQSAPSVVSWEPGRLDIFVVGTDSGLYHRWWDGAHWGGFEALGGQLQSEPTAVSWAPDRIDVFALGEDNACWHRWWDGHSWGGWESLGGTFVGGKIAAACWGPNRIDLFGVGTDHALWHKWWDGHAWGGWESLGGTIVGDPTVVSWDEGRLDVFAQGTDHACWHRWWDGHAWGGWESLHGDCHSEIAATSWAPNRLDLFTIGADSALWHQTWDGHSWSGWVSRGGILTNPRLGAPLSATTWSAYRTDVFGVGTDSAAYFAGLGSIRIPVRPVPFPVPAKLEAAGMPSAAMTPSAPARAKAKAPKKAAAAK
ncbi:MAG TPA: hypothetical protein VI408_06875 [Gaiellaceae bacterium]